MKNLLLIGIKNKVGKWSLTTHPICTHTKIKYTINFSNLENSQNFTIEFELHMKIIHFIVA